MLHVAVDITCSALAQGLRIILAPYAVTTLASNAATLFPSPRVPSLGKRASANYKRRIVFPASAIFNQLDAQ